MNVIVAIEDRPTIHKILTHHGLSPYSPPSHLRFAIPAPLAILPTHPCTWVRISLTRDSPDAR